VSSLAGTSAGDYGNKVYARDNFTCVFCGFDGRLFDNWMQLSVDHILPKSAGGDDTQGNLTTACRACNSITSRMKFAPEVSRDEVLAQKRARVEQRRRVFYDFWIQQVAPLYLERPLPPVR